MMDRLMNALKGQSAAQDQATGAPRFGLVTSVDPATATAPRDATAGRGADRLAADAYPWAGNGWGLVCPPSPGDQVLVIPQEGDAEHGLILATHGQTRPHLRRRHPVSFGCFIVPAAS